MTGTRVQATLPMADTSRLCGTSSAKPTHAKSKSTPSAVIPLIEGRMKLGRMVRPERIVHGQLSGNGSGLSSDQVQKRFPNGSRGSRPGIAVLDVLDDALFMQI